MKQTQSDKELDQMVEETIANGDIAQMFDKMINDMKEKMATAKDGEVSEYAEMIKELEADKEEMLEGLIVGSPQYIKDEQTVQVISISTGIILASVAAFLLMRTRNIVGKSKMKIAGWILGGLGISMMGLFLSQMFL